MEVLGAGFGVALVVVDVELSAAVGQAAMLQLDGAESEETEQGDG